MKVLVTGANGYIGTGVVKQLLDDGCTVIATDFSVDKVDARAERISVNIFDIENPYDFLGKPDVLLHLAWRDGFQHDSINHLNDLPGHFNFIRRMIQTGVEKVCVLGSMHEIGFYEGSIDEKTPANPESLYGISKNALRKAVELETKKNKCIFQWIRGYYIVGNTAAGCSIFSKITAAERAGKEKFPFTTGMNQYDFIDYDLFCEQVAAVTEQNDINGIINCCTGIPMRLGERVEQFIKENNYNIALEYGAFPDRPYDSKAVWGNSNRINEIMEKRKK